MESSRTSEFKDFVHWLGRTFLGGLSVVLPLGLTLYLLGWLLVFTENLAADTMKALLPGGENGEEPYYIPGMGIAALFLLLFVAGISLRSISFQRILDWEDRLLRRIPLVRTLYTSIRDIGQYFTGGKDDQMGHTVIVTLPETSIQLLGFMTKQDAKSLDGYALVSDPVLVYLPMSYQVGGYLLVLPRSAVQPIDMPFDEAMSFIFMAGMKDIENGASKQEELLRSAKDA